MEMAATAATTATEEGGQAWRIYNVDARATVVPKPSTDTAPNMCDTPWSLPWLPWATWGELETTAHVPGSWAWCLAHLLRLHWAGQRVVIAGDRKLCAPLPFLVAEDTHYPLLTPRGGVYAAAALAPNASSLLPEVEEAGHECMELPDDALLYPYSPDDTILILNITRRQYMDPRAFGEDGTFGALLSTPHSALVALVRLLSHTALDAVSWAGERVAIGLAHDMASEYTDAFISS